MQVHKITLMVVDFDKLGAQEVASTLENQKYPNYCISPSVMEIETADAGEWCDEHPLNHKDTEKQEFERLFTNKLPKGTK